MLTFRKMFFFFFSCEIIFDIRIREFLGRKALLRKHLTRCNFCVNFFSRARISRDLKLFLCTMRPADTNSSSVSSLRIKISSGSSCHQCSNFSKKKSIEKDRLNLICFFTIMSFGL